MNLERSYNKRHMWKAVIAMVMMGTGAACFVLSCVAAMITINKE